MAFHPNQDHKAEISSFSMVEDNDGKPEIHFGVTDGKDGAIFKLKFKDKDAIRKSVEFALKFGADKARLKAPAYVEQWGHGLIGKTCYFRTKEWEMNGKTGVFISQMSPIPFPPVAAAVSSAFASVADSMADGETPF